MRHILTALAAIAMLAVSQVHADTRGPSPQIIAEYDRSFIERSGAQTFGEMLDTGILRYFFTGGRNLLILVNGRPYATTGSNLDTLPLSAVERIEVIRAESLGTLGGLAAVRGAMNLVLRKDLDGFDVRSVTREPRREGGDAFQGSVVWGGEFGTGGHMTVGIDVFNRNEITAKSREHSRSEWTEEGGFPSAKNVSLSGNTVYIYDNSEKETRSVALGAENADNCNPAQGYTGPLSNPPGAKLGDKGCGFAYAEFSWDTGSKDQKNATLNLSHPLGESAELHVDGIFTLASTSFRYAPSVDVFSITPTDDLLAAINASTSLNATDFTADKDTDYFSIGHRFIGHGNRDWRTNSEEYDVSTSVKGQLTNDVGYDVRFNAFEYDRSLVGNTFVDAKIIGEEIAEGRYDLSNPLSTEPDHLEAIAKSSLTELENTSSKYMEMRLAFDGIGPSVNERNMTWTAGIELTDVKASRVLEFRDRDGGTRDVNGVLGSGGTSYSGERDTMGAFTELSLPLADSVDMRAAARVDDYDDVGKLRAWRLGAEYSLNEIVTLRGSWSTGDGAPSMLHLHSTAAQDHPYVRCIPDIGDPPRTCKTNWRQVTRVTVGNPQLEPPNSERRSIGAGARMGPFYLIGDWYWLETSDLPGQNFATYAILNYPECPEGGTNCIQRSAGDITIHDSYANIVKTEISGVNTRFGARKETDWGFLAMRGFWRYVTSSKSHIRGDKRRLPLPRNAVRIVSSVGRGNLTAYWSANYRDEIMNLWGQGRFNSWIGHDLTLDWKNPFGLEKTRLTAGVYNVTDAKLSKNTSNPSATDGPSSAGWGRTFFVTLNMRF